MRTLLINIHSTFKLAFLGSSLGDSWSKSAFTMISDRFYQRYHYESRFRIFRLAGAFLGSLLSISISCYWPSYDNLYERTDRRCSSSWIGAVPWAGASLDIMSGGDLPSDDYFASRGVLALAAGGKAKKPQGAGSAEFHLKRMKRSQNALICFVPPKKLDQI